MSERVPEWSTLNAYVDCELDPRTAAAVAGAAGRDPAVAEDIAVLYSLKGITHDAFPEAPPDLAGALPRPRRWRRHRAPVIAAASLVAVVLGAIVFGAWPTPSGLPDDALATARGLHTQWLEAQADDPEGGSLKLLTALDHFRQVPVVPDLQSAGLTIQRVRLVRPAKRPVLQVGYRGVHGCHLSLFVFTSAEMPETMARVDIGLERAYGWRVHGLGYIMFARGMDKGMFELIALKVEEETRTRAPLDDGAQQLLAARKRHSSSCVT